MSTADRYEIKRLTCRACGENQRRVVVLGKPPRCVRCRKPLSIEDAVGDGAKGLAKAGAES